jgi:predicted ATP-grasp superfamily ATP-dependent carboligase
VVVNVVWTAGISAIHSLGRAGIPVHAVDFRPEALGFRSRYARTHVSPRRLDDEDGFVEFLARLGKQLDAPAPIFPLDDDDLNLIARRREELGDVFLYPFPNWETLRRIQEKRHQLERARDADVPTPRTASGPTDELGFPVLVKPDEAGDFRRRFGVKAFRCENARELEAAWERAREFPALVWELIPGGDEELYTFGAYVSRAGEALTLFTGRKLVQDPRGVGTARVAESVWVPELVEAGLKVLRALEFHGPAQVEFKRDPRDGVFKLIEVNPRLWQWHGLTGACGVDVALTAYRDLVGEAVPATVMRPIRRRWAITFKADRPPMPQRPPYVDPLLAWHDPALAVTHLVRYARSLAVAQRT